MTEPLDASGMKHPSTKEAPVATTVPFETTDLGLLRTLSNERLEQRARMMFGRKAYPLRFKVALAHVLRERSI